MRSAPDLERALAADLASFTHDPLGFVRYVFPWGTPGTDLAEHAGPRQWQREVLEELGAALRRCAAADRWEPIQKAVASGHGPGKSTFAAWLVLWGLSTFEDTKIVVTANTDTQLKRKTWPELAKWHRLAINRHWFTFTATSLHSADPAHEATWRADAIPWSEHRPEAFAGLHNQGKRIVVLFDEASAIPDAIWEVTEGALTDAGTEILWVAFGNPTRPTGRFAACFGRLRHRWGEPRQIDARTVEGTNKAELAKWVEDYGEDSDFVKVRVRGMFPATSAKQFIATADVDAAYGRVLRADQYRFAPKILTVDPAWEGDDECVIGLRQGLYFRLLRVIPKNDNDVQMANLVARLEDEESADAVFIDGGYGTGIVSVGRTLGRAWQLVWFGERPYDPGCVNKRAEMWKATRDWLKEGGAIPADPVLHADLIGPEALPRMDGKLLLEPKEAMKARGLKSPNRADALALSFAYPVAAPAALGPDGRRGMTATHYNPDTEDA